MIALKSLAGELYVIVGTCHAFRWSEVTWMLWNGSAVEVYTRAGGAQFSVPGVTQQQLIDFLAISTEPNVPSFYNGSGVPSDSLGADGSYYLDDLTGTLYHKLNGTWS